MMDTHTHAVLLHWELQFWNGYLAGRLQCVVHGHRPASMEAPLHGRGQAEGRPWPGQPHEEEILPYGEIMVYY